MNVTGDPAVSKRLWETDPKWRQYVSYPALRAKTLAKVLAESAEPLHENKFGRRPLITSMLYGRGRVLFIGDSAHIVPIFGVRGLNNGFADAVNAAWKLAYVLGWTPNLPKNVRVSPSNFGNLVLAKYQ